MTRYIGKTCQPLPERHRKHLLSARSGGDTHRDHWIRSLLAIKVVPRIDVIELVNGDGCAEERNWIAQMRSMNWPLVNTTIGGEGVMTGKRHSLESRIKIGFKGLGRKQSTETIAKRVSKLRGRKCSPETRAKIAASKLGTRMSQGARIAMSESSASRRLTQFHIDAIRECNDKSQRALAELYGVTQSHISRIRSRKVCDQSLTPRS